jgi:hypothetical protein
MLILCALGGLRTPANCRAFSFHRRCIKQKDRLAAVSPKSDQVF